MTEPTKPPALEVERVPRETMQDRVHRALSDLILDGQIAPGQFVTIQSLADAFGVSPMPVREALHRLTAARALTVVSGRSIGVAPLSLERLRDLSRVRSEIEPLAADWAATRLSAAELDNLASELAAMERATREGDVKRFLRGNRAFHFMIYRAAGSEALLAIIESLWLQVSPFFNLLHASGNYAQANLQHAAVLDALRRRDGPAARRGIVADISAAAGALEALLV